MPDLMCRAAGSRNWALWAMSFTPTGFERPLENRFSALPQLASALDWRQTGNSNSGH
jgi:hypothetical protein